MRFKAMKKDQAMEEQNAFLEHLRMNGATEEEVQQITQHIKFLQKEMNKKVRQFIHEQTKKLMVKPIITGSIIFLIPQIMLIAFGYFNLWSYIMGASIYSVAVCLIYAIMFTRIKTDFYNQLSYEIKGEIRVKNHDDGEGDEN